MAREMTNSPHAWGALQFGERYCACGWRRMSNSDGSYIYQHIKTDRTRKQLPDCSLNPGAGPSGYRRPKLGGNSDRLEQPKPMGAARMSANVDESKHDWAGNLCPCGWKRIHLGYGRFRYFHTRLQVAVIRPPVCVAPVPLNG